MQWDFFHRKPKSKYEIKVLVPSLWKKVIFWWSCSQINYLLRAGTQTLNLEEWISTYQNNLPEQFISSFHHFWSNNCTAKFFLIQKVTQYLLQVTFQSPIQIYSWRVIGGNKKSFFSTFLSNLGVHFVIMYELNTFMVCYIYSMPKMSTKRKIKSNM